MKRLLKIEVYNGKHEVLQSVVCGHLDATKNITVLSESRLNGIDVSRLVIPEKIENKIIENGIITIFYESGIFIEISRIYA